MFVRSGLLISFLLLCTEVYILQNQHLLTDLSSMYLSLPLLLFFLNTKLHTSDTRILRSMTTFIYCGRVWIIAVVTHIIQDNLIVSIGTMFLSTIVSFLIVKMNCRIPLFKNLY